MSAIAGILSINEHAVNKGILYHMQHALSHRGKDDRGDVILTLAENRYKYCGLASCVRFSKNEAKVHQPVWNEEHSVYVIFDGELYRENSNNLSDAEYLLQLYLKFGISTMFNYVHGTWACCIVDQRTSKIYLVRDKMGEKPLYIYQTPELLLFASEYKAFYCHPEFKHQLNHEAVSEYFVFRYACGETTFIENVINLAPGYYLEIYSDGAKKVQYYTLPKAVSNNRDKEYNRNRLRELLQKSVEERLCGQSNVGVQLSGGVDSSYICSIVKQLTNEQFNTYSVTFNGYDEDESRYIEYVNESLGLIPNKFDCKPIDFLNSWQQSTWHFEAPMNHEGTLPLYDLNKLAAEKVSAVLCGDGPDESMGGYPIFRRLDCFYREWFGLRWLGVKIKAYLRGKKHFKSREEHFISLHQFIKDNYVKLLRPNTYKDDIKLAYKKRMDIMNRFCKNDHIHRLANYDLMTYGVECAMRTEKMAMAHGITIRSPFLSTDLQEFLLTVPAQYLTDYRQPYAKSTKMLLKELCAEVYGESFTYRPKIGLGVPNHEIFANPIVRKYIDEQIMPSIKKRGIVDYSYIQRIWQLPLQDKSTYAPYLLQVMWVAFSFEVWAKMFIDSNPLKSIQP